MRTLEVPATQLSPLQRSGRDGIGRLARRTQRGQGRRRLLVLVLIALSVGGGVASAVYAATAAESDRTIGVDDRFGPAAGVLYCVQEPAFADPGAPTLTAAQQAWLDEHEYRGDPEAPAPEEPVVDQGPIDVDLDDVIARVDAAHEDLLRFGTTGMFAVFGPTDEVVVTDIDVTHPLAARTFVVDGDTRALSGQQALLSPLLLDQLGAAVGDRVDMPSVGPVEVVGTVTRAAQRSQPVVVVAPGREPSQGYLEQVVRIADAETVDEVQRAVEATAAELVPETGGESMWLPVNVETRADFLRYQQDPTTAATLVGGVVTGLATSLAGMVAACAFAVGVRRRIREIGMLGAIGASPSQLRALLRREGLLIGLGGAVLGAVVGAALVVVGLPLVEGVLDRELRLALPAVGVVLPILLGGAGALIASIWPARTAARVPVVTALAGRVPLGRVPSWLPVVGLAAAATGIVLLAGLMGPGGTDDTGLAAVQLLGATLLATLGMAALGIPVVAGGGRIADRLPLVGRLALRDAARQRTRSGAAIAALVPVLAIPVAGLTTAVSDPWNQAMQEQRQEAGVAFATPAPAARAIVRGPWVDGRFVPPTDDDVRAVASTLPGATPTAEVIDLGVPDVRNPVLAMLDDPAEARPLAGEHLGVLGDIALGTPELLAALDLPRDTVTAERAAVLDGATYLQPPDDLDRVHLATTAVFDSEAGGGSIGQPAIPVRLVPIAGGVAPQVLLHPEMAETLGLVEVGRGTLLLLDRPPTQVEAQAAWDVVGVGADNGPNVDLLATQPFWRSPLGIALLVAAGVLAVVLGVAVVAGMTAALAATESDADIRKAVALGAPPALRRWFHGVQAWWHTAIAAVLGAVLGIAVAGAAMLTTQGGGTIENADGSIQTLEPVLDVPWLAVLGWVGVMPILVGLLIAAVMRSAPVGAPRRRTA